MSQWTRILLTACILACGVWSEPAAYAQIVQIRLAVTDPSGTPITMANVGGAVQLRAFVQDLRTIPPGFGVFAAYMDITYTASRVAVAGPISFADPPYTSGQSGDTATPGLIDEVGAFDGSTPLGTAEILLFTVPFTVTDAGTVTFAADPAEDSPDHDVLVFGRDTAVPLSEVTYGTAALTTNPVEFGDAPMPYPTLLAQDGARHIATGPFLGTLVDVEADGQPDATATGDDLAGSDDEDGVLFTTSIDPGQMAMVDIVASSSGLLNAWLDFNADGDWDDAGEQIFTDRALSMGLNSGLTFAVPASALSNTTTFARFRFSTMGGLLPTGLAPDGEVEDYQLTTVPVELQSFTIE